MNLLTGALGILGYQNYHAFPIRPSKIKDQSYALFSTTVGAVAWNSEDAAVIFDNLSTQPYLKIDDLTVKITNFNKPYSYLNKFWQANIYFCLWYTYA